MDGNPTNDAQRGDDKCADVFIGTSGWSYKDWVGPFYPEGTPAQAYLPHYASQFSVVEVDSTYYAIPSPTTVAGWAEKTPASFRFAPKIPGVVTHGTDPKSRGGRTRVDHVLVDAEGYLERFLEVLSPVSSKVAALLFQFPYFRVKEIAAENFRERLDRVLTRTRAVAPTVPIAVEIRNKSWITSAFLEGLAQHRASPVMIDHPYMPTPRAQLSMKMVGDIAYLRFLGDRYGIEKITKKWGEIVEDKSRRLEHWADVIRAIATAGRASAVYVFSNNHFAGHAPETCRMLQGLLRLSPTDPPAGEIG